MAKAKTDGISQSEHIRRYIARHQADGPKSIVAGLHEQGIEVSYALASHVKFMSRKGKRGTARLKRAAPTGKPAASRNGTAAHSKADHIRTTINELGRKFRPRDVIARLAEQGISVTASHVIAVAKNMGLKRRRRGRRAVAAAGVARRTSTAAKWSLEELLAAKRMADQLGGVEAASRALAALARLG